MFVLSCSNIVISALKNVIPDLVRIPGYIVVIATFVTVVQMCMEAFVPAVYASLGLFIPLSVVNCIVLGRAEAFAAKNGVVPVSYTHLNKTYSAPLAPSTNLLRFLKKDELEISDEAMYWARLVRDASTIFDNTMTFRDTVIVNPLFMPIVFRGDYLPENLIFYNFDSLKERTCLLYTSRCV